MAVIISQSPHIRSNNNTRRIMLDVCIALSPCAIMGVVFFGIPALLTILVSVFFALGAEIIYNVIMGETFKSAISKLDYSSMVTGLIIALIMPANYHLYIPALSSIFAIIVVKMLFGGTGNNLVNPAAVGRIFAFISFTTILDNFTNLPSIGAINGAISTGATSLQSMLKGGESLSVLDLFLGSGVAGCIGETCKVAILVGAIYLAFRKIIKIWLPLISLACCGLLSVALNGFNFSTFLPYILSGGFFFCAFFMATDYVTNPTTNVGNIIFFALFGLLTALLRKFTGFETSSFAILLCNILVPLIEKISIRKPFGYVKPQKEVK